MVVLDIIRDSAGGLLAKKLNRTYVNLSKSLFQNDEVSLLTGEISARFCAIPLYKLGEAVTVGMADSNDQEVIAAMENLLMKPVSPVFCFRDAIVSAIKVNCQSAQNVDNLVTSFDLKIFQGGV